MIIKKFYKSKTLWFNAITLALGIIAIVNDMYPVDPQYVLLVSGIGNLILRFITSSGIGDEDSKELREKTRRELDLPKEDNNGNS